MKKALKITGIVLLVLLLVLFVTPYFFKDRIAREVKKLANRQLTSEMNFSGVGLSFFSHFPNLTLNIHDFSLMAAPAFPHDTLVNAKEVSLGINLKSLFGKTILITQVYIDHARVNILYNERGEASFNVYRSSPADTAAGVADTTSSDAELNIDKIRFIQCRLAYYDNSIPVRITADGFDYTGRSTIDADYFNLTSKVDIKAVDIVFNGVKYLDAKPVKAKLSTRINHRNLAIDFQKNDLMIKDIPLQFNGRFAFEKDGYQVTLSFLSVLEKEFLSARFKFRQSATQWVSAKVNASVDLGKWAKALDVKSVDIRGLLDLNLAADGNYYRGPDPNSLRKDTILLCIPKFSLMTRLTNGYLRYQALPQALNSIRFDLNAGCPDSNYKNINVHLKDLEATFLKNEIKGNLNINSLEDVPVEADLSGGCNLAELRQVFPVDSLDVAGMLKFDIRIKGNYNPAKKLFPKTTATLDLSDGQIKTAYYPKPIGDIGLHAEVTSTQGTTRDVSIRINPLTFRFEGQKFTLTSTLANLDDLEYDVKAGGIIDLGKVYQVFAQKGTDLDGFLEANLSLRGRQSDAAAGRYERLKNSGTLVLRDITLSSELFPDPFIIRAGNFRFDQDKVWFTGFRATYGASDFELKGNLSNIISYALSKGGTLKGNFQLNSQHINVDEFMAFSSEDTAKTATPAETGVVIIPQDLDIVFKADIKSAEFQGLKVKDIAGEIDLKKGILMLKEASLSIIDCKAALDATYGSITPEKAFFDFRIKAQDFDIKRAYNEITLVRELASAAGKAEGLVSIDYALKGRLNADMYPVMPSLEGGGTLSVKKVKVYGLKLFNDISKGTEKESLNNPDVSKVDIKSTIKNNTITLERFKFKVKGIRVRIEGTTTFSSRLNLKMRLGMGPLGIIGIPIKVSGPMENLKIRYGRGGENEEIPDSAYSDQLPPEMLNRIKSVKEEPSDDEEPAPGK